MAHRFDVVAIRIDHKGTVVVRVIVGPERGRAVVTSAGRQGRAVERVDRSAVVARERDVNERPTAPWLGRVVGRTDAYGLTLFDPEVGNEGFAEPRARRELHR